MLFLTIVLTGGWVRGGRVSGVKVCREFTVSMHTTCIGFYDIGMNCFLSLSCHMCPSVGIWLYLLYDLPGNYLACLNAIEKKYAVEYSRYILCGFDFHELAKFIFVNVPICDI